MRVRAGEQIANRKESPTRLCQILCWSEADEWIFAVVLDDGVAAKLRGKEL